ncbi:MAG: LPS assembly lipoprotein LptE [Pseudomonadota bacterium]
MRNILLSLSLLTLAACGFHLRGSDLQDVRFGFKSVYLKTQGETPFVVELRRTLGKNKMEPVATPDQAELILEIVSENTTKQILSLSGSGRVREYQLGYRVSMRAYDLQQVEWLPPDDVRLNRTLAYDDALILAKQQEEAQLYKDMRADAVAQTVRRLMRAKPQPQE